MSPIRKGAALLGVLLLVLGAGVFGYYIGDYYATSAVADQQCPLYTDFSKPLCRELLNRLNADQPLMYVGDVLLVAGGMALIAAVARQQPRSSLRPPNASEEQPR